MHYLVTVSYDGSNHHGFSRQKNVLSIQGVIEDALQSIYRYPIKIIGSGRTDASVHAIDQKIQFTETKANLSTNKVKSLLNKYLPSDIHVVNVKLVNDKFHCLRDVKSKTYIYKINTNTYDVFLSRYMLFIDHKLNIKKLKDAMKLFIGEHDFLSFSSSELTNTIRIIYKFNVTYKKGIYTFKITGNGFLRYMVRMILGSIIAYHDNKLDLQSLRKLLLIPKKGSCQYKLSGNGLCLKKITY